MTKDQAKFILQAFRQGEGASAHPDLEEAFDLLRKDAGLQKWFRMEQAFDEAFSAKLARIEPPHGLADTIFSQVIVRENKVVEFPWWKQFSVWGAVASMALVLGLVLIPGRIWVEPGPVTIPVLQEFANQALKGPSRFAAKSSDWTELVSYLGERNIPAPINLPDRMDQMPAKGCMTLEYQGKPVGVICFGKNSESHIFVVDTGDFPELPHREKPVLEQTAYATTAYWTEEDRHYLLVTHDPEELGKFVSF
ncbi:MAG: hypothetical protein F7O42_01490 [Opitutae bacterium]|nr:hypothetical protein [Opitutae bacterium]